MKKTIFLLVLVCLLTLAGAFVTPYIVAYRETVYSKDFDESNFEKVVVGMDLNEVKKLLGEPIKTTTQSDGDHLIYSESPHSTHYFQKSILIQDSKVTEIMNALYFD